MSGIWGLAHNVDNPNKDLLNTKQLHIWNRAYGKEAEEVYTGDKFCLGCCYEKLSPEAKQSSPILKSNGIYASIDALLFNRDELIEKCHLTEILSDEELLLTYIDYFGIDALKDINGDFSGAIYDDNKKTLTLFRDHLGIRPLYYFTDNNFVVFSTDMRGLLSMPQVDTSINEDWLFKTIAGYSTLSTKATEFSNIFCVNPASYVTFSFSGKILQTETKPYWQLGSKKIRLSSEKEYQDNLRSLITDAIKRRLDIIPGIVGAELSGGLDSSVIDILINRLGRECIYFSWSTDPREVPLVKNDERLIIDEICKQENITCHYSKKFQNLDTENGLAEGMQRIGIKMNPEEPPFQRYVLPPHINTLYISETAQYIRKNGARVIFTGHGGDEGVSHRSSSYELFYNREYFHFFRQLWSATYGQKHRIRELLKRCRNTVRKAKNRFHQPYRDPLGVHELLQPEFSSKFNEKDMPHFTFAYDPRTYIQSGGSRKRLDNVALQGAFCDVRYLVPYLDYRVVDYAVSIPRYLYWKGRQNRYIFRETFKDILPPSLYALQCKEDPSQTATEQSPDYAEILAKRKAVAVNNLNREYWKKYLNFDIIDEWLSQKEPSQKGDLYDLAIISRLTLCGLVQNLIDKTRS